MVKPVQGEELWLNLFYETTQTVYTLSGCSSLKPVWLRNRVVAVASQVCLQSCLLYHLCLNIDNSVGPQVPWVSASLTPESDPCCSQEVLSFLYLWSFQPFEIRHTSIQIIVFILLHILICLFFFNLSVETPWLEISLTMAILWYKTKENQIYNIRPWKYTFS